MFENPVVLTGTLIFAFISYSAIASPGRGLVKDPTQSNQALMVGVSRNAYPNLVKAIRADLSVMEDISTGHGLSFRTEVLLEEQATRSVVLDAIEKRATETGRNGTLLLYFSGLGTGAHYIAHDEYIAMNAIRGAVDRGRVDLGPLARLVLIFDTDRAQRMIDIFVSSSSVPSWNEIFTYAGALDGGGVSEFGSVFTLAFVQSLDEGFRACWQLKTVAANTNDRVRPQYQLSREFAQPQSILLERMCD